ncbi:elongation factor 4 [Candidatus Roizmanbacteria bacterium RIFCSPHIGHO2_01_FULL_39_12b]|uniref:Elongation factor 4 n=1 Tax=Candidatus Roizmanbacteria bacterium RIFCSPHIGHO2_01_FULL_39_12b TaxID=1802030 RepID=A0A1F7G955_9BACT|nr:MAG: elongation factor 4 [Candidatus Roizmanbacteria bacterium RIFCSPHIGHO2_01_FULL_39_12b]OGK45897.1 MAG: elongation factor 4 [Candidatus Roizmanbacteria bacterium RIFCSPLOWO2_01_FULL_39_19]
MNIRNFAIIAHVDHGKSTLADRLLELTGVVSRDKHEDQLLDRNPISRERGITIKLAPVRMQYPVLSSTLNVSRGTEYDEYILNLIDTPGHVDFSYEVERTLACVEGAILLVDATKGIQAQTIAHAYKAISQNLTIISVVNKIDSPQAQVEKTVSSLSNFLGIDPQTITKISAKNGTNVEILLNQIVKEVPSPGVPGGVHPRGDLGWHIGSESAQALIFDSYYDPYRGVIAFVRVFGGSLSKGQKVKLHATNNEFIIDEVGVFSPDLIASSSLSSGEIGYVVTKLKDIHLVTVGDTMSDPQASSPLSGYKKVKPMIFSSVFSTDEDALSELTMGLEKLSLNDSALTYEPVKSNALGTGFRVGFLGLLHADVVRERLEREFKVNVILTPPTVEYIQNERSQYLEPIAKVSVVVPSRYIGEVTRVANSSRGVFEHMDNPTDNAVITYTMPLMDLISGFFDTLKTVTSGYGSLDWELSGYQVVEVDKMEILLNDNPVNELSRYVIKDNSFQVGREICKKLKKLIPRQQYEVKIQAKFRGKIIASERVSPLRKDVTAKLYGGDRTRKDKLLKQQKKGKKLMKQVGTVEIPKEAFLRLFVKED